MIDKILIADESVTDKIYVIRNQRVMLDSDIAELYDVETRILNQAVNRSWPKRWTLIPITWSMMM